MNGIQVIVLINPPKYSAVGWVVSCVRIQLELSEVWSDQDGSVPGLVTPAPGNSDPSAESTPSHASQHFPHFYGQERAGQSANLSSTLILIFTLNNCKNGCKYVDCCSPVLHLKTFIKGDDEVTVSVELEENCTLYCAHRHFKTLSDVFFEFELFNERGISNLSYHGARKLDTSDCLRCDLGQAS